MGVCVIFAIMAYFYTYNDPAKIEAQFAQDDSEEKKRRKSLEMTDKYSEEIYYQNVNGGKQTRM